jgi:hypothetical protein
MERKKRKDLEMRCDSNEKEKAYIVPIPLRRHRVAEIEGKSPPARAACCVCFHVVAFSIVVPGSNQMAGLDMGGSAELKGGSRWSGRHGDSVCLLVFWKI